MRALTGNEVEPTLTVREARAGDRYLLCSDGLSDVVSDETIANTMREGTHDECADRLIELALRSGGPDNVTVVVADVIDLDYGQSNPIVAGAASGDDDEDTPPPNTAAGRAAAMRPPRATPKRVIAQAPETPPKKRSRLWWPVVGLALIALVAVGLVVGRQLVRNNYYVGDDDGRGDRAARHARKRVRVLAAGSRPRRMRHRRRHADPHRTRRCASAGSCSSTICGLPRVNRFAPGCRRARSRTRSAQMDRLAERSAARVLRRGNAPTEPTPAPPATPAPGTDGTAAPGVPPAEASAPAPPAPGADGQPLPAPETTAPEVPAGTSCAAPDTRPELQGGHLMSVTHGAGAFPSPPGGFAPAPVQSTRS